MPVVTDTWAVAFQPAATVLKIERLLAHRYHRLSADHGTIFRVACTSVLIRMLSGH